jgi:hypothetical protein
MNTFELSNSQRKYFGLKAIHNHWDRISLSDYVAVYFNKNQIEKVLNYSFGNSEIGYFEYDTNIATLDRKILIPLTSRGKDQKLTIPRLLKIRGNGISFSATFVGGGIHVFDNKRNIYLVQSYFEDGPFKNYADIDLWIDNYIKESPENYFEWLKGELAKKRKIQKVREGDIIAFKIARYEYGFARVLFIMNSLKNEYIHPRSLTVGTYSYVSGTLDVDIDELIKQDLLPSIYIFDNDVYYSEMLIIGNRNKSARELDFPLPLKNSTSVTNFYTKTDILEFGKSSKI